MFPERSLSMSRCRILMASCILVVLAGALTSVGCTPAGEDAKSKDVKLEPGKSKGVKPEPGKSKGVKPEPGKSKDITLGTKFVPLPKATFYMGGGGGKAGTKTEIKEAFE